MDDLVYEAPAKINLSLEVGAAHASGYHPLRSLVQALEWCDTLAVDTASEDRLDITGADLESDGSNLAWKAIEALASDRPRLHMLLDKQIPAAAGLGGGSANAAAALVAVAEILGLSAEVVAATAPRVGADVSFFLTGGTAWMEGYGERITPVDAVRGCAVAVVVPPFELSTPEVYRSWDRMDGPKGPGVEGRILPPALREFGPLRNDLAPAAIAVEPELGDWIADLGDRWGRPVCLSGSGPALFGYFTDVDEAASAAAEVAGPNRSCRGVAFREVGVFRKG